MTVDVAPVGPTAAELLAALHGAVADAGLPVWSAGAFAALLGVPGTEALVARAGDRPLGLVLWRPVGRDAEVLTLGVVPEARRQGVGTALVAAVVAAADCERLLLEVAEDNAAARALYAAHGFTEAARRRRYYRRADGSRVDALVLARTP